MKVPRAKMVPYQDMKYPKVKHKRNKYVKRSESLALTRLGRLDSSVLLMTPSECAMLSETARRPMQMWSDNSLKWLLMCLFSLKRKRLEMTSNELLLQTCTWMQD